MQKYFVTGIGTEVGKTVVSAVLTEALAASYWKPVQAGDLENTDSMKIARLSKSATVLPEGCRLRQPMSPHAAAELEGVQLQVSQFRTPVADPLIVEGAGGLLVPLNQEETMLDLIRALALPVIVVSRNYLGSINHTLLTLTTLQQAGVQVAGLVVSGTPNEHSESIILKLSGVQMLGRVAEASEVTMQFVTEQAERFKGRL